MHILMGMLWCVGGTRESREEERELQWTGSRKGLYQGVALCSAASIGCIQECPYVHTYACMHVGILWHAQLLLQGNSHPG